MCQNIFSLKKLCYYLLFLKSYYYVLITGGRPVFLWSSRLMPLPSFSSLCPGGWTTVDINYSCLLSDFHQVSANGKNQWETIVQEERKVRVFILLTSSLHGLRWARVPFVYQSLQLLLDRPLYCSRSYFGNSFPYLGLLV